MYRFLLRPAWLLSHLAVLLLVITLINLGLWQLRRLDEKQALNDTIESRSDEPVVDIGELIAADADYGAGDSVDYRSVSANGVYQADDEVLVHNRTLDGSPGRWVLTPLLLADGTAVVVNRGLDPLCDDARRGRGPKPNRLLGRWKLRGSHGGPLPGPVSSRPILPQVLSTPFHGPISGVCSSNSATTSTQS